MEVLVVYTEEYYGNSEKIKVFRRAADAEKYHDELSKEIGCDILISPFILRRDLEYVYVTVTEEWYGDIRIHETREEAESRTCDGCDIIVFKRVIQ